jgi:hypothetical protein
LNNQSGVEKEDCLSLWPSAGGTDTVGHADKLGSRPSDRIGTKSHGIADELAQTVLRLALAKIPTVQRLSSAVNSKSQRSELGKVAKYGGTHVGDVNAQGGEFAD